MNSWETGTVLRWPKVQDSVFVLKCSFLLPNSSLSQFLSWLILLLPNSLLGQYLSARSNWKSNWRAVWCVVVSVGAQGFGVRECFFGAVAAKLYLHLGGDQNWQTTESELAKLARGKIS